MTATSSAIFADLVGAFQLATITEGEISLSLVPFVARREISSERESTDAFGDGVSSSLS